MFLVEIWGMRTFYFCVRITLCKPALSNTTKSSVLAIAEHCASLHKSLFRQPNMSKLHWTVQAWMQPVRPNVIKAWLCFFCIFCPTDCYPISSSIVNFLFLWFGWLGFPEYHLCFHWWTLNPSIFCVFLML